MSGRTRKKSPHGFGRKPFYKEHRLTYVDYVERNHAPLSLPAGTTATEILATPKYRNEGWLSTGLNWTANDQEKLRILCEAAADVDRSAVALGRTPSSIANRARDTGFSMPAGWRAIIKSAYKLRIRIEPLLQFPFIKKSRLEHDELLRVNAIVPRGYSEDVRADIVQSVMLALFEGTVTMDELECNKDKMRYFIGRFYKDQRPHEEVQLLGYDDAEPNYDTLARLHDEHQEDQRSEIRRMADGYMDHQPATQIAEIYNQEIAHTTYEADVRGLSLTTKEVRTLVEMDDWHEQIMPYAKSPTSYHAIVRTKERYGIDIDDQQIKAMVAFCSAHKPLRKHPHSEIHAIKFDGERLAVVFNRASKRVLTVLPREELDG